MVLPSSIRGNAALPKARRLSQAATHYVTSHRPAGPANAPRSVRARPATVLGSRQVATEMRRAENLWGNMSTVTSPIAATRVEMSHARVILAASLGTGFEWYDFFLYGSLAGVISKQFFTGVNETTGFIFALLTFAAGFAVRPF